jgi:hypothetical protein
MPQIPESVYVMFGMIQTRACGRRSRPNHYFATLVVWLYITTKSHWKEKHSSSGIWKHIQVCFTSPHLIQYICTSMCTKSIFQTQTASGWNANGNKRLKMFPGIHFLTYGYTKNECRFIVAITNKFCVWKKLGNKNGSRELLSWRACALCRFDHFGQISQTVTSL